LNFRSVRLRIGRLFKCSERVDGLSFALGVYLNGRGELLDVMVLREGCANHGRQNPRSPPGPSLPLYDGHQKQPHNECSARVLGLQLTTDKETNLRVCLDLEPTTTKVALAPEGKYGRRVVHSNLLLLGVVANAHAYVGIASSAVHRQMVSHDTELYIEGNVHTTRC